MKKLVIIILGLVILAFVFADSLYYLAGRWQEKAGRIKEAVQIYSRLVRKYPRSKWVAKAKEAIEKLEKSQLLEESREGRKREETQISDPVTPYIGVLKKAKEKIKGIEEEKQEQYEKWLEEREE